MLRRLIAGLLARPPAARSRPASGVVTPAATDPAGGASESVPELEALAERAARSGCHAEAISHLERAAALTPQDLQLQLRLAQARVESRQFSVAAAGLASAIAEERRRSAPDARALGRAELMLGLSRLRSMALDDAFAAFLRAYEADPSNDVPLQLATYSRVMQFEWPCDPRCPAGEHRRGACRWRRSRARRVLLHLHPGRSAPVRPADRLPRAAAGERCERSTTRARRADRVAYRHRDRGAAGDRHR